MNDVGAIINRPPLSEYGKLVDWTMNDIHAHYPNITVDKYIVMPNHVHMIVVINGYDGRLIIAPTATISTMIVIIRKGSVMEKKVIDINGIAVAVIQSEELIITDAQSALDLIATVQYYDECDRMAVHKEAIIEDFFMLSTGIAGEVLQKFVNYSKKLAIIGDFSGYSSKPLKDFIYECNKGNQIFFVANEQEAVERLSAAV